MRWLVGVAVLSISGTGWSDESRCRQVRSQLADELVELEQSPIRLSEKGDEECELPGSADVERGRLGRTPVVLKTDGPHGSGHYWTLALAVQQEQKTVGVCLETKTAGWRSLPSGATRSFPRWRRLKSSTFVLWSELSIGSAEVDSIIFPVVYRLKEDALIVDPLATRAEIQRFGRAYARVAARRDDSFREMHRSAAEAYEAFASGTDCPR